MTKHTAHNDYIIAQDRIAAKNSNERAKIRSKTFQGIADAMAAQWGAFLKRAK